MRDQCNRLALRYLAAVVCGLSLLLFRNAADSGLPAVFVPQRASPWEISKLAFWPSLVAWALTGRLGGGHRPFPRDLPAAVVSSIATAAAAWALLSAGGDSSGSLAVWAAVLAAAMAFCPGGEKHPVLWTALALLLAGLYMLLTFTPPAWGPFLAPPG